MRARPLTQWVLLAGLAVWIGVGTLQWWLAAPLGHDESQYAIAARDLLAGEPQRWFYVSPGMNVFAVPGVVLGWGEHSLRLLPLLASFGFIAAAWLVARHTVGAAPAAWTIAVLAGCRSLLQRSSDLLSDLPAATCLLFATYLIITELDREDGPRRRIVLVAPLLAAAFYVRYGSVIPIAVIVLVTFIVWWRSILRSPAIVAITAVLFIALLVPHLVGAMRDTGSPLGLLFGTNAVVGGSHGDALVDYLTQRDPFKYYGLLAPPLLVAGLASIVLVRRERPALFLWLVAVGSFLGMGLLTHAQPRYVFFSTTLLIALGIHALIALVTRLRAEKLAAAVAVVAIVISWISVTRKAIRYPATMRGTMLSTLVAGPVIRRDAHGARCFLFSHSTTQPEWYSGCRAVHDTELTELARRGRVYVIRDTRPGWQPVLAELPPYRVLLALPGVDVVRID